MKIWEATPLAGVVLSGVHLLLGCSSTALSFTPTPTVVRWTRHRSHKKLAASFPRISTTLLGAAVSVDDDPTQQPNIQDSDDHKAAREENQSPSSMRPLQQNWWPVAAIVSLNPQRPNALQVLGKKLVAVYNSGCQEEQLSWHVLDDRCSHRFAPLSEGRLVISDGDSTNACKIQCAYHGWEFETDSGTCTRVPQQQQQQQASGTGAASVQVYPVRNEAGILWVWTDPTTVELSETVALPISPLLQQQVGQRGNEAVFMRDLPYGMEILGENLLDLSHLPFSHHSVGSLQRSLGGFLPTRMLSQSERVDNAQWEKDYCNRSHDNATTATAAELVLPRYQAEIVNAAEHDPILKGMPKMPGTNTSAWTTTIAFYDPCHVRYRRNRGPGQAIHVELFLCPTSEGRSRVFLFNIFERPPPMPPKLPLWKMITKPRVMKKHLENRFFSPGTADGHLFAHKIFDGDGIFLHKQGNRMKEAGLSFRDYSTPASADVLLNAYRRFLDAAALQTSDRKVAQAVVGMEHYGDDLDRCVLLDRYNSHTKHCPICLSALQQTRRHLNRVRQIQTMAQGAFGASTAAVLALVILRLARVALARPLWPVTFAMTCVTRLVSRTCRETEGRLQKRIDQFLFEDYVHAEKD